MARAPVRQPLRAAAGLVAALILVVAPASPGHAEPDVATIERQIADLWAKAEPLIERYNFVHEEVKKNRAKQALLQRQLAPLEQQVAQAQTRVGKIAAEAYKGGNLTAFTTVLGSGSPQDVVDQLSLLNYFAKDEQRHVAGVTTLIAKYQEQKQPIDRLVASLAAQDAELATQKTTIEGQLTRLQALRIQAYGSGGGTGSFRPWACPSQYLPTAGYKAAQHACKQAGDPYVWAADGPNSYDCSGLTLDGWRQVGVYLPHNAAQQRKSMPYVNRSSIAIGDLVFYYGNLRHVGIYVGNGKIVHAPTFGDNVRMAEMDSMPIHSIGRPNG